MAVTNHKLLDDAVELPRQSGGIGVTQDERVVGQALDTWQRFPPPG